MKIGYGRVSTRDQHPDAQHDALAAAGSDQVFVDKASGKLARRPELDRALLVTRAGDQFVVTKLDRLGRSLEHLILDAYLPQLAASGRRRPHTAA
jgi:DNA invertase Pin-like site-specific DNA recombinase